MSAITARGLAARLRDRAGGSAGRRGPLTVGGLLATVARALLWLAIGVLLVRGIAGTVAAERRAPLPSGGHRAAAVWPDDAARAFAVQFTSAYLTSPPRDEPGIHSAALEAFAPPELAAQIAPRFDAGGAAEAVRTATVAHAVGLDDRHALMTVAATVASGRNRLRRVVVTVPIARDEAGGLAVDDLPSFSSAPARATVGAPEAGPLLGDERAAIEDVLRPFLRDYLAGDTAGLAYLVPPGARIAAAAGSRELLDLTSITTTEPATRAGRVVLVGVQARDARSRATYALRYRLRLVKRERWYVAEVNGAHGAG